MEDWGYAQAFGNACIIMDALDETGCGPDGGDTGSSACAACIEPLSGGLSDAGCDQSQVARNWCTPEVNEH